MQSPSKNYSVFTPVFESTWFAVITSLPLHTFILFSTGTIHWLLKQGDGKVSLVWGWICSYKSSKRYEQIRQESLVKQLQRERLGSSKSSEIVGAENRGLQSRLSNLGLRKNHCQTLFPTSYLVFRANLLWEKILFHVLVSIFSSHGTGGWGSGHMHRITLQKANKAPRCQGMDHSMCCCSYCTCMDSSLSAVTCSCLMLNHLQESGEERHSIPCHRLTARLWCHKVFLHWFLPFSIMGYTV